MGTPVWIEYGERATGDNDPVYGASGIVNRPAKTIWSMLTAEHGTDGTHNTGVIDQAEINLTSAAAANGDAVRYDEYSVHTHVKADITDFTASTTNPDALTASGYSLYYGIGGDGITGYWYILTILADHDPNYQSQWWKQTTANNTHIYFRVRINGTWYGLQNLAPDATNGIARTAIGSYTGDGTGSKQINLSPAIRPTQGLFYNSSQGMFIRPDGDLWTGASGYFTVGGAPLNINGYTYYYLMLGY